MKTIDKVGCVLNVVLSVIYIPLSLFSWLLQMASEMIIDANNPLFINLVEIFCVIAFLLPLLCIVSIVLSVVFRHKGHSTLSFAVQFFPLIVFVLNLLLLAFAESLPAVI